jgi:chromate reductase, NAD(P)H dehydrogenase (quinone)
MLVANTMLAQQQVARPVRILGISGSGRTGSFNTALLEAAKRRLPDGATLETYDVTHFPLYNPDLERSMPAQVKKFKELIRNSDAVMLATPEYNHSVSAVMKNALEWGNRPWGDNSWDGKPVAIISASTSMAGGARAQEHLRQIFVDLNMRPLNKPQVLVSKAHEKFSTKMELVDDETNEALRDLLARLVEWARALERIETEQVLA